MKLLFPWILSLLLFSAKADDVLTKTIRWNSLNNLLSNGWVTGWTSTLSRWDSPMDADPKLINLNANFSGDVWGWKAAYTDYNRLTLDLDVLKFCGITNATLDLKIYASGKENASWSYIFPVNGYGSNYQRPIELMETIAWHKYSSELNISHSKAVQLQYYVYDGDVFVIDEVALTYTVSRNDDNCPNLCNHDCEYRPIGCHFYYTCVDETYKEVYTCSKSQGLAFNPITKTCDFMRNVEGCNEVTPPEDCVCLYKPHETDCSAYYFCKDSCHLETCEERRCPAGLTWSTDALGDGSGLQQCVTSANATCESTTIATTPEELESTTGLSMGQYNITK